MAPNIWVAAADNQVKVVESYLDSKKFEANSMDPNGYTAIHAASSYGHIALLRMLLTRGGDINIQDSEGDTPLHHVEDVEVARVLVEELGADWKIQNYEGQTAADYIEEDGDFPELANYLRSLAHDQIPLEKLNDNPSTIVESLPMPGFVDGHQIRYTLENEPEAVTGGLSEEERRKKIEKIINSANPEVELRDLVKSAVQEGLSKFNEEGQTNDSEPSHKRNKGCE